MNRSYGAPGKGAIDKIVDDIYFAENPPEENSEQGCLRVGCARTFGCAGILLLMAGGGGAVAAVPESLPLLSGLLSLTVLIVCGYLTLRLFGVRLIKKAPEPAEYRRTRSDIDTEIWSAFTQFRNGTPIEHTAIPKHHKNWAVGALTEMRVAGVLDRELPPGDIVLNDLDIAHGKYNIDHVVLTRVGAIQVDSKAWSKPVPVIPSPPPSVMYQRHANPHWLQWTGNREDSDPALHWDMDENGSMVVPGSHHADAVGTCIFEASHLPGRPIALVFAVEGDAEAALPRGGLQVSHYSKTAHKNSPIEIRRSPFPIVFCRSSEVASVIRSVTQPLLNVTPAGLNGPAHMSMDQVLSADGISLS